MAQRTQVLLTCDVHEGDAEAVETVLFTVDGQSYECELCEAHLAEFRDAMEIWSSHSRSAGRARSTQDGVRSTRGPRASRSGASRGADGPSAAEVREWARAEGMPVSARGRVPAELHAAFAAAH
ncbi:MAG: Lsr2 family protein [Acidimicrobiales bacterium]